MKVARPSFTIIVPTLNRPETLPFTLKTILSQDYANFRVLVSDNSSDTDIRSIVAGFNDARLTYIRTPSRLSMSHHWEFVLDKVHSGFVTIIGDDDGLLPNALTKAAAIIQKHGVRALGWRFSNFNWAGLPPNFVIPMGKLYRLVDARKEAMEIMQSKNIYRSIEFPSLYGGFADISLLKELRSEYGGRFFHSRIPDFFSGALIAASVTTYARLMFPLSINASSRFSTGWAAVNSKNDQQAFKSMTDDSNNIPFHPKLKFVRSLSVPIAEAMLQVNQLVPSFPELNMKDLLEQALHEAELLDTKDAFDNAVEGLKEIAAMNGLTDYAAGIIAGLDYAYAPAKVKQKYSPISDLLYFNTENSQVNTVEDAVKVVSDLAPRSFHRLRWKGQVYFDKFSNLLRYFWLKLFSGYKKQI